MAITFPSSAQFNTGVRYPGLTENQQQEAWSDEFDYVQMNPDGTITAYRIDPNAANPKGVQASGMAATYTPDGKLIEGSQQQAQWNYGDSLAQGLLKGAGTLAALYGVGTGLSALGVGAGAGGAGTAATAAPASTAAAGSGAMSGTPQLGLMQLGADPSLLSAAGIDMGLTNAALSGATGGSAFPSGASLLGSAGLDAGLTASAIGGASGLAGGVGALAPTTYNATLNSLLDPFRGGGTQSALETVGSDAAAQAAAGGAGSALNLGGGGTSLLGNLPDWARLALIGSGAIGSFLDAKNQPKSTGYQPAVDAIKALRGTAHPERNFQMTNLPGSPWGRF